VIHELVDDEEDKPKIQDNFDEDVMKLK
jgi:hypothetical protein